MANQSNPLEMLKHHLSDVEEGVLNRNIGRFDRWIAFLEKTYTAYLNQNGSNINNEIATWISSSIYNKSELNGMSFLQIAVVSGSPDMVKRVLAVCVNPTMPTNFDIEYKKQAPPHPYPETQDFDGKTARGIVDKILSRTTLPPEYKENYTQIRNILTEIGAQGKYPKYRSVMTAIKQTGSVVKGVVSDVGTVIKAAFSAGGSRKRQTLRKNRRNNKRKTRSN